MTLIITLNRTFCESSRVGAGDGGRGEGVGTRDFSWVSMHIQHLCKTTLSEWSLSWKKKKNIPFLSETEKNTLSGTILFKILCDKYTLVHILCQFRYPNWVIWVTQPF